MDSRIPNIVFGYHGCDEEVGRAVINGDTQLKSSENDFDWLGHGIYFWENAPNRAWQFANEQKARGIVKTPFVIGAVLVLGNCMDLLDIHHHATLFRAYEYLRTMFPGDLEKLSNKGGKDKVLRYLDCAVFLGLHDSLKQSNEATIDSIRCAFEEGKPSFPGSGILDKTHIQICVRNPACMKGFFRPLDENGVVIKFNGRSMK